MRCAVKRPEKGERVRRRAGPPRPAARWLAGLAAACLLAACTGTGAHRPLTPAQRFFASHPGFLHRAIFFGGGGAVAFFGGTGAGSRPAISVPPVPPAGSSLPIPMPLEAYQAIEAQQQEVLAETAILLAQRCMAARGFDDPAAASAPSFTVARLAQIETAGAGLASTAQAETFGFGQPKGAAQAGGGPGIIGAIMQSQFDQALKTGTAYTEALYGFNPHGGPGPAGHVSCLQQASQAVYGPLNGVPAPDPVPQIAAQAVRFTQTDPRVRAADRAWSRCMARRYFRYPSPGAAEGRGWPSPPTKAEIATAVADVACKAKVNLVNIWLSVEAAYQQALIRQNLAALAQLQDRFAPLLRRAAAAVAAAPGTPARAG
jgi:hypothetical protein